MKRIVILLVVCIFTGVCGLGLFLIWHHRPYETPDWVAAYRGLEEKGDCAKANYFLANVTNAGVAEAPLHMLRLSLSGTCAESVDRADLSKLKLIASEIPHLYDRLRKTDANEKQRQAAWSFHTGWRETFRFVAQNWQRPDLVFLRTQSWLLCSQTALLSNPIDYALIERAIDRLGTTDNRVGALAPQTRLQRERAACAARLHWIANQFPPQSVQRKAVLEDATAFASFPATLQMLLQFPETTLEEAPVNVAEFAYRERYGPAADQIARWYLDGSEAFGIVRSPLDAAFWGTYAVEYGSDAQEILVTAKSRLTLEEQEQFELLMSCQNKPYFLEAIYLTAARDRVLPNKLPQFVFACRRLQEKAVIQSP